MIKFIGTAQDQGPLLFFTHKKDGRRGLKAVKSDDGFEFLNGGQEINVVDDDGNPEKNFEWSSFRISGHQDKHFLTYKAGGKNLQAAMSYDLLNWEKVGRVHDINETGTVVSDYKYRRHYVMYYGEKKIKVAYSAFLYFWKDENGTLLSPRKNFFDSGDLEVANAYYINGNILLVYYSKINSSGKTQYKVGAAIFDGDDPTEMLWRADEPIWEAEEELKDESFSPVGCVINDQELILYWQVGRDSLYASSCQIPNIHVGLSGKKFSITKHDKNPIIEPRPEVPWESRATFNSAAVLEDGEVHFFYRALGDKDLSVLGHATSSDGLNIDFRSSEPAYIPREPFETPGGNVFNSFADHFASGGGYGGVEDPRITKVEDKFYLTYVAFDGANPPRAAVSSIDEKDFKARNWGAWGRPKLISAPGMVNKSAVIFPRKVNGKYVVLHRVYPNILVDFLDDLEFDNYLQGHYFIPPRKTHWDSKKVGAGAPPMETKDGWLLIYQSVGHQDPSRYKIGAMMLDSDNPHKVLYRTDMPVIEPDEEYENVGHKAGVVYPCGSVIKDGNLNVYYGGADTVVCAATADLDRFLYEMKHNKKPKLQKINSSMLN